MKLSKKDEKLIEKAKELWEKYNSKKHTVSSIVLTKSENIFQGMSMDFDCGIGICAERIALFKMMPKEREIKTILAFSKKKIISPCGVCRELMYQMHKDNLKNTWVILSNKKKVKLKELLPSPWK